MGNALNQPNLLHTLSLDDLYEFLFSEITEENTQMEEGGAIQIVLHPLFQSGSGSY